MKTLITRTGRVNSRKKSAPLETVAFAPKEVVAANKWYNSLGNPSFVLYLKDGRELFLMDDYGAMNDIDHLFATTVKRKKDL